MKYRTKCLNEFNVPMVLEKVDDNFYRFYWEGSENDLSVRDGGTKREVIQRLLNLIKIETTHSVIAKSKGYKQLYSSETKDINIYKELLNAIEDM